MHSKHHVRSTHFTLRRMSPLIGWLPVTLLSAVACFSPGCTQRVTEPRPDVAPATVEPSTIELGRSVRGVPVLLHVFGDGQCSVLIFGAIHGNEPTSADVAQDLMDYLRAHPTVFAGCTVGVIPVVNPDGLAANTRVNANRVDVNRNFPASNWRAPKGRGGRHGEAAASEPETQALIRAVELLKPARIVAIHSIPAGKQCNNYDGPAAELAELMAQYNAYPVKASIGYPTPGSFGTWAGIDGQIPTITLELPRNASGPACWEQNRAALLAFIQADRADAR